ncbi:MAG: Stp1/IreP family PP2C-type Ser/Thr phosphatase [Candidatus Krumholzibacteriota bacterium]|nr:Stp1/IreP family PP2C-type Ser/Thr phosphatase [Candidatus Krumholzibacteriota bacterium]
MLNGSSQKVFTVTAASDRGQVREKNEDFYGVFEPETEELLRQRGVLVIVADGMGGHFSGAEASRMVVEVMGEAYFAGIGESAVDRLEKAFRQANREVFEQVGDSRRGVAGTTCTSAVFFPDFFHIVHAGDSRAYRIRDGRISQLTEDHSVVGKMLRDGILDEEGARNHPRRNVITKAVGLSEDVEPGVWESLPFESGDSILICSDGLTSMLREEEIVSIITGHEPPAACDILIQRANEEGGKDNITLVIVKKN